VILAGKFRTGEVAQVKGFDCTRFQAGVGKGFLSGHDSKTAQILFRKCSKGGLTRSHDRDTASVTHLFTLYTEDSADDFPPRLADPFRQVWQGMLFTALQMTDDYPGPDDLTNKLSGDRRPEVLPEAASLSAENQERFFSENLRRIFLQIYRMVGNVHDAQDLTQEAFIKALQRQDQLKDGQKAAHWLSRIATNTALDFLRRHNRITFCEISDAPESLFETPEAAVLRGEQKDWLTAGLDRLTPRERAAIVLRDVEELPAEEVARRLDCSKATVRSHIANARIKLRKFAERRKR
jgi:RNA polymerase sigma-70 factor (ECF subfamily)